VTVIRDRQHVAALDACEIDRQILTEFAYADAAIGAGVSPAEADCTFRDEVRFARGAM
jgi:hypothetical protein